MIKLFLVGFLLPLASFGQDTINNTGSKMGAEDAKEIVNQHNKARSEVAAQPLTWSTVLAAHAQEWADSLAANGCKLKHRPAPRYGENIYWSSSSQSFKPVSASLAWYSEKEKYTYSKVGEGAWQSTLHYTQMVWKNTKEVGAGMAVCPNGSVIVVANYNPAGNYSGEHPY